MKPGNHEPAQPGDILIFYNAGKLAHLITWFTQSPFYHVAIYEGDGKIIESRPRGVVRREISEKESFFTIPAPQNSGPRALEWARDKIGENYDVLGVAVLVLERLFWCLNLNYHSPSSRYVCGELVLRAFRDAGVDLLPGAKAETVVPADFAVLLPEEKRRKAQKGRLSTRIRRHSARHSARR